MKILDEVAESLYVHDLQRVSLLQLRGLKTIYVIKDDNDKPLAVLFRHRDYVFLQDKMQAMMVWISESEKVFQKFFLAMAAAKDRVQ